MAVRYSFSTSVGVGSVNGGRVSLRCSGEVELSMTDAGRKSGANRVGSGRRRESTYAPRWRDGLDGVGADRGRTNGRKRRKWRRSRLARKYGAGTKTTRFGPGQREDPVQS